MMLERSTPSAVVPRLAAVRPHHNEPGCVAFRDFQNGRHRIAFFRMGHGSNTACLRALRSRSQYGTRLLADSVEERCGLRTDLPNPGACSFARLTARASACSDGSDPSTATSIRAKSEVPAQQHDALELWMHPSAGRLFLSFRLS